MALLKNLTQNTLLAENVMEAKSFWARSRGLLGQHELPLNQTLWIKPCNSIHTFFMKFAIDVIFVNHVLVVKAICLNVQPGRILWPKWSAHSVFEFMSHASQQLPQPNTLTQNNQPPSHIRPKLPSLVQVGDQLYVGH